MKRWIAVALLIPATAACYWVCTTILGLACGSCCSSVRLWDAFETPVKLTIGGLYLWHAAAAVAAALGALGLATKQI